METTENQQSVGLFELVLATILFAPISFFLGSYFFGESLGLLISLLLTLGFLVGIYKSTSLPQPLSKYVGEIETFGFFAIAFSFFLWACLQWPDFIAIGERLRDYALLSSVFDSPIIAREPWMVGENLNYYLYWYRFAAYWASILGLSVWFTYHLLAAFSFALFTTCQFRIARCYLRLSLEAAIFIAFMTAVGSNLSGIISGLSGSNDWWGPSRVIKGMINEFPAWSFLLGDLHPHFLNLCLTLLLICMAFALAKSSLNSIGRLFLILGLFCVGGAWHYNCNAWEVPMAGITFATLLVLALFSSRKDVVNFFKTSLPKLPSCFKDVKFLVILGALVISLVSLIISSANIKPGPFPWRLVQSPIPNSTFPEIMLHWGIPLICIFLGLILRAGSSTSTLFSLIVGLSIAMQNTLLFLLGMLGWVICAAIAELKQKNSDPLSLKTILVYGLGISSFILIILGELIFLDDPYGGENERMNTIFKIYSATWAPLHLFAFVLLYRNLIAANLGYLIRPGAIVFAATLPAFFIHTFDVRKNPSPSAEGLASIESQYSGAADIIRYLRAQPRQVVLEAQGNPYSYTTHIATLGNDASYLGWANHVGLLTGNHEEVSRREKVTSNIYNGANCQAKKELAAKERIEMIVVGPLEREKYGSSVGNNFECFERAFGNDGYTLYKVGGV